MKYFECWEDKNNPKKLKPLQITPLQGLWNMSSENDMTFDLYGYSLALLETQAIGKLLLFLSYVQFAHSNWNSWNHCNNWF